MNVVKAKFFNFHTKKRSTIAGIFALQIESHFLAFLLSGGDHKPQTPKRTPQTGQERKSTVVGALARRL
jgi:hypothetical protein